jgi:hypothetical protein
VKDANGNALGTLLAISGPASTPGGSVTIYNSGYAVTVNMNGTFPDAQIYWTSGTSCSGSPYLNDSQFGAAGASIYYKTAVWSGVADGWFTPSSGETKGLVTSLAGPGTSFSSTEGNYETTDNYSGESYGPVAGSYQCSIDQSPTPLDGTAFSGWPLTTFDPQTTFNWPAFSTCTVTVLGQYDYNLQTTGSPTTRSESCLAGPLQLP